MAELQTIVTVQDVTSPPLLVRLLRSFADKLVDIGTRLDNLVKQLVIPTFGQISVALQSTGPAPLNVTGLRGLLADPQPASAARYDTVPSGLPLQSLRDSQFILVKNGVAYDLYTVLGGNPSTLFKLIAGASGGTFVTTDTVQNIGPSAAKTFLDNVNVTIAQNAFTSVTVTNTNSAGTGAAARYDAFNDLGNISMIAHGSGRTATHFGVTLGGYGELQAATNLNGLLIGTIGSVPMVFGTNNAESFRADSSQNLLLKKLITLYNNVATAGMGVVPVLAVTQPATDRTTALGATTVFAVVTAGMYRLSCYLQVTTAGTSGNIELNSVHTDRVGVVTTSNVIDTATGSSTGANILTNGRIRSTMTLYCAASTNIQVATIFNTVVGTPHYYLDCVVERMS